MQRKMELVELFSKEKEDGKTNNWHFLSKIERVRGKGTPHQKKELLAIVFVIKKFEKFLLGRNFSIFTDNLSLVSSRAVGIRGTKTGASITRGE